MSLRRLIKTLLLLILVAVAAAKVLSDFAKDHDKKPAFKLGILDQKVLQPEQIDRIAKLPTREQLMSQLVGAFEAPMAALVGALRALEEEAGLQVCAAFEHEFWCEPDTERPWSGFSLEGVRRVAPLGETLLAALSAAGVDAQSFLPEYGRDQYEVTVAPRRGLRAADECVIVRELARATAERLGRRISFAPKVNDDVGNGLHLH